MNSVIKTGGILLYIRDTLDIPVYQILAKKMKLNIATGNWRPGGILPSYKELSVKFVANPHAVIFALEELEREKLLIYKENSFFAVTQDLDIISELRDKIANESFNEFLDDLSIIDYPKDKLISMLVEDSSLFDIGGKE